jgi:hypothetical protein
VWAAPVGVAALVAAIAAAAGAAVATDGFGTLLLFAVHCGTWTALVAALWLAGAALARLAPDIPLRARRWGTAAAFLGTSLPYYVLQLPSYAHAPSVFAAALALYAAARLRSTGMSPRAAGLLGAVAGLGALVRPQDAVLGWVPLVVAGWRPGSPGAWRRAGAYAVGFAVVAGLQALAWTHLYGASLAPPQGAGFLGVRPEALGGVLFSARHGWLAWTPVVGFAVAGWVGLALRPATRTLGTAALAATALVWLASAAALDWWAGWAFGARRFTTVVPLVALGLAAFAARGRAARIAVAAAAGLGLVQYTRVATRALSGDADPGFEALWGGGFFAFLPRLPAAVVRLVATRFTDLQVLRRPDAPGPTLAADAPAVLVAFFVVWCALVVVALVVHRRSARGA